MISVPERGADVNAGRQHELPIAWQLSSHARRLTTLAVAGLVIAVITRRAEFAGLAAPALLLLVSRQSDHPRTLGVEMIASAPVMTEGQQAVVLVRLTGPADGSAGGSALAGQARVRLHPAAWIAVGQNELGGDGWFRLPFEVQRWGIRP